jgi:hypothetical protein
VTCPAGNDQVSRDIIEAVRHIESIVTVCDQLGLRTTNCTRPHTLEWLIWAPTATLTNR